ncbi:Serine/arginine repetitive matrix protein 2 [Vanrija albida]|uniref:Serine/arginine repetitive matrix protein 2 n=1 Tax=Vanrija albida TaxID=181172 RepID=A0ABR3PTJ2_9TREE
MSYNNVGLSTARGSGTNGYIVRNTGSVKVRDGPPNGGFAGYQRYDDYLNDIAKPMVHRAPDAGILEHERKRQVEIKCLELRDEMEDAGADEGDIEDAVSALREKLSHETIVPARRATDSHSVARAKEVEMGRLGRALNIGPDHVEGRAFQRETDEEKAARLAEKEERERQRVEAALKREREAEEREAAWREKEKLRRREEYYRKQGRSRRDDSRSPSPRARDDSRSPAPRRRDDSRSRSPAPRRRDDSDSPPRRARDDSASPPRRRDDSRSPPRRRDDSASPPRRRADSRSPAPRRDDSRSPSRSASPPRRRRYDDDSD